MFNVKHKHGELLTDRDAVTKRWQEYCEELYFEPHGSDDSSAGTHSQTVEREPPPLRSEIVRAIQSSNKGKAPGHDGILAELYKAGGDTMTDVIHQMYLDIWDTGQWPTDWTQSVFIPLPKKGDPTICGNYRTISLVSHASKIFLSVIISRTRNRAECEISEEQAGFCPCRGTRVQGSDLGM